MRAGRALREKWADEARHRADPGYYARHWRAHELRQRVIRRYAALLSEHHEPAEALELLIAAQDRLRVDERDRMFRVTARPRGEE